MSDVNCKITRDVKTNPTQEEIDNLRTLTIAIPWWFKLFCVLSVIKLGIWAEEMERLKVSEPEGVKIRFFATFAPILKLSETESVRIWRRQNFQILKLSETKIVRIFKTVRCKIFFQLWKQRLEIVRNWSDRHFKTGRCQKLKVSEPEVVRNIRFERCQKLKMSEIFNS